MKKLQSNHTARKGFTLIEVLVVLSLSAGLLVAAMGLFFTTLLTNSKKGVLTTVKDEGDFAVSQIEFLLRNAIKLVPNPATPTQPACVAGMSSISFRSVDNRITTLTGQNGKIASQAADLATPVFLTSDSVTLTGPTFNCSKAASEGGTYVNVSFTLRKQPEDFNTSTAVQESFNTSVNIRSL